jgi:copper homeostasis protein
MAHATPPAVLFEACVDSTVSALRAISGGAHRLELCDSLVEGGLTPSIGKIKAVSRICGEARVPLHVLIRPRSGDFFYNEEDVAMILEDALQAVNAGAHGIVVGALIKEGRVDKANMAAVVSAVRGACAGGSRVAVTFHRAIDVCRDPTQACEDLHDLGLENGPDYILTSGCASTALEGAETIRKMRQRLAELGSKIEVIAGGGVTADNAGEIVRLSGVTQIHGTARATEDSEMTYRRGLTVEEPLPPIVYMGGERRNTAENEWSHKVCSSEFVKAIIAKATEAATEGSKSE